MNITHCYVVMEECHPVEVFYNKNEAIDLIQAWTGSYPSDRIRLYRCPLSPQTSTNLPLSLVSAPEAAA